MTEDDISRLLSNSPGHLKAHFPFFFFFLKCVYMNFPVRNVAELMNGLELSNNCEAWALKNLMHSKLLPFQYRK